MHDTWPNAREFEHLPAGPQKQSMMGNVLMQGSMGKILDAVRASNNNIVLSRREEVFAKLGAEHL